VNAKPRAFKPANKAPLFAHMSDHTLAYGVTAEWLADVNLAKEESLFTLAEHLPAEAAEALLELATGNKPQPDGMGKATDPFSHPNAQRRFRVMHGAKELTQALNDPWEKWTIFLPPSQQQWAIRDYAGPARVSGSASTVQPDDRWRMAETANPERRC
jgi:hypothetical protein